MNKLAILFILMVAISACTNNDGGNTVLSKDIYKGTQGVVLNFYEDKFPNEVYEGEDLVLVIKAENKGAYKVENAKLLVSLEKGFMDFNDGSNWYLMNGIDLREKTYYYTFDDFKVINIPFRAKNLDPYSEYHDSLLLTNFCYDYMGIASADVCIDTDPHDTALTNKACSINEGISLSSGQGGPVSIDRIDTSVLVDDNWIRPQFKIYIINQGSGTATKRGTTSDVCNQNELGRNVYNIVDLDDVEFSRFSLRGGEIECIPTELFLRTEQDSVTCTLRPGLIPKSTATYKTPLKIAISYGYLESKSKQIKIKKILTG